MKLIMESWRGFVVEEQQRKTWGQLAQDILNTKVSQRFPQAGRALLRMGWKSIKGGLTGMLDGIEELDVFMDRLPENVKELLEDGAEEGVEWVQKFARQKGGKVMGFVIDDIMGADDSLTKNLAGFSALNIPDEYEKIINRDILKTWAKKIMRQVAKEPPNEIAPDLIAKLEKDMQTNYGAHPDIDDPDRRKGAD